MRPTAISAFLARFTTVFSIPPDASAGTGGSAASGSTGTGTGSGGSSGTGDGGAGGAGSGGGTPFDLRDDAQVTINGQTGRWADLRDRSYMARDRYDQGVQLLNDTARSLDLREQALLTRITQAGHGRGADGQPIRQTDPFAELEGMGVVDGKTLANLARQLIQSGERGLGAQVKALAAQVKSLEGTTTSVTQRTNVQAQREAEIQFDTFVTDSLGKLGVVQGIPEGVAIDPKNPFLRELARDLYSSHDADSWKSAAEFQKQLGARVAEAIAFVRTLDTAAVEAGHQRRRTFLNPRKGNGSGSNQGSYKFQNGKDLSRMLFEGSAAAERGSRT